MALSLPIHRIRFIQDAAPKPIICMALHPYSCTTSTSNNAYIVVIREGGNIELWMTGNLSSSSSSSSSTSSSTGTNINLSSTTTLSTTTNNTSSNTTTPSSTIPIPTPNELAASWTLLVSIPGISTISIRNCCWIPIKSRTYPGFEGCRLFVSSLNSNIYEVDWINGRLVSCTESHAGSIWYIASFNLSLINNTNTTTSINNDTNNNNGAILAAGCEDGSVRLYRVYPHARELEFLVSCPGTDGRILCLNWHTTLPILFVGTANGVVKGWDFSMIVQTIIGQHQTAQEERKKLLAKKANQKNQRKSKDKSDSSDDSDSSSDDDIPISTSTSFNNNVFISRSGQHIGPRALIRMQLDNFATIPSHKPSKSKTKHTPRLIWSILVLQDLSIITGDSKGEINVWNGRTGTLESSVPLIHTEGDILSLASYEDKSTGNITVAAGASDARVFILTRNTASNSSSKDTILDPIAAAEATRWVHTGTHTAHASDVRSVIVGNTSIMNNNHLLSNIWIASGAADAQIAITRLQDIIQNNFSNQPRLVSYFGQRASQELVSFAKYTPLVASYHQNKVQLFTIESKYNSSSSITNNDTVQPKRALLSSASPSPTTLFSSATTTATYNLLLEINTPTINEQIPEFFPSSIALSTYGTWLAYSSSSKPLHLVSLQYEYNTNNTSIIESVIPTYVSLPERILSLLSNNITISHLQLVSYQQNNQEYSFLLIIASNRLHVCLCSKESDKEESNIAIGKKRSRTDNNNDKKITSICRYLYSLPIPYTHSESIVVQALNTSSLSIHTKHGRNRSGTQDSLGIDSLYGGNDADDTSDSSSNSSASDSDDDKNTKSKTNQKVSRGSYTYRPMTNIVTIPLQLTTELVSKINNDGTTSYSVLVGISTTSRHVHIYSLTLSSGSLVLTLPRLPTLSTALAFTSSSSSSSSTNYLIIALKDGTLCIFDPLIGRIVPSYSGVPGDKQRYNKQFLNNNVIDSIHTLLPITSPLSSSSIPFSRLLCIGNSTISILQFEDKSIAAPVTTESKGIQSSSTTTNTTTTSNEIINMTSKLYPKYAQHIIKGNLIYGNNTNNIDKPELCIIEIPWKDIAAQVLPVTAPRRKYGT